jgi:hypothetical protein
MHTATEFKKFYGMLKATDISSQYSVIFLQEEERREGGHRSET